MLNGLSWADLWYLNVIVVIRFALQQWSQCENPTVMVVVVDDNDDEGEDDTYRASVVVKGVFIKHYTDTKCLMYNKKI